jgi:hypothetical protein
MVSLLSLMTFALVVDGEKKRGASQLPPTWFALLWAALIAFTARYWAAVEHNWSIGIPQSPGPRARLCLWYRPVNGSDLLARILLIFSCCVLLIVGMKFFSTTRPYSGRLILPLCLAGWQ